MVFQNPREREDETKNSRESEISRLKSTGQSRIIRVQRVEGGGKLLPQKQKKKMENKKKKIKKK